MLENQGSVTYKQTMNSKEMFVYAKAVGAPVFTFLLSMFLISQFGAFGTNLLAPLASGMWIIGAVTAFFIPSQRSSICNETHGAIIGYLAGLWGIRLLILLVAGTSTEQLMASYSQALPLSSGSTISGFLQTMIWITSVMFPIGFASMQGKKLLTFRKRMNKQKTMDHLRGIRDSGRSHNDYVD